MAGTTMAFLRNEIWRLEDSAVNLILRTFGLEDWKGRLHKSQPRSVGRQGLTFEAFDAVFPGFPICMRYCWLESLVHYETCSQAAMFRKFRNYPPYQRFLEIRRELADCAHGRPIGIIYPWQGLQNGLILHDGDFPTGGFQFSYTEGSLHVRVERLGHFLRSLAAIPWTLDSLRFPGEEQPTTGQASAVPTPWKLARVVTDKVEFDILALLVEILYHMPPAASQRFIVCREGERWIAISQDDLAKQLGVATRTVQRAIAGLREKGLVETKRNSYHSNEIRVCLEALA